MIKPDWNIFKAKFSENPQNNFEWLCYLLFCEEFGKEFGVFRYKNQSGIETNPVSIGKEIIGWQAKFYETTLSDHKSDLISTLIKSKRDYIDLSKIIFYTNGEWGQSHNPRNPEQNDPQAKVDIENKARELGLQIEWRTASFFESSFVTVTNDLMVRHFFSFDKSIFQLLSEKQVHTETILENIQTSMNYQGKKIEINRDNLLDRILREIENENVLMITGPGGVGKTAVIKRLYEEQKENIPLYIFKSSEFETNNIDNLFGEYSLQDFIKVHKEEKKLVVIDSAEKLLDLENTDPFKEFVSVLLKNKWKIIFTARSNYLSDLDMQFIDQYQVKPIKFYIEILSIEELIINSQVYNFTLPVDTKLLELLRNLFYLNEYLKFNSSEKVVNYKDFKEKLWNKIIKKSQPSREQCFMKIAFQRVSEGQFFILPESIDPAINFLVQDGILGYETAGYFISHDIYEEWALEKIIDVEFIRQKSYRDFFANIGESLPVRRSLRKWVSEQLLDENSSIENFIEEIIEDNEIPNFWKDEILVSVLLSSESDFFVNMFEEKLLENNRSLLKQITFLLRIACKEVDEDYLKLVGFNKNSSSFVQYVFTKPQGKGWGSIIRLIYKHKDNFVIDELNFLLPVINEWNSKFKQGETTKLSALIALSHYQRILEKDTYFSRKEDIEKKLIQTILNGSAEIKAELSTLFEEILKNRWKNYQDPYYELVKAILTKIGENQEVIKALPGYVIKLANLYWSYLPEKPHPFRYSMDLGVEKYFGIEKASHRDYSPPSAFQTPIYWLLQYSFKETVDFLLRFINKSVECYVESDLDKGAVEEVEIVVDSRAISQYVSMRLWSTYRGTQVAPDLFQSIHMALEKFLLEIAKNTDSKILESNLLYLIRNSKSSSITAMIVSIVLAHPDKTFNVAKVLFQTKEFFLYDTHRMVLEPSASFQFSFGAGIIPEYMVHEEERKNSYNEDHRRKTLEQLALSYQFFKGKDVTDEEVEERQKTIWSIFDKYYEELKNHPLEDHNTWRLYLARMDRRKMNPTVEKVDEGLQINFNPEIDSDLIEYSESSLQESSEAMKYTSLKLWSDYRFVKDEKYKEYTQYENNPKHALKEVEEILSYQAKKSLSFANKSILPTVCAVMIRDYYNELTEAEKKLCINVILDFASSSFTAKYTYQIGDGVEAAISILPYMLEKFPEEKEKIKAILLLILFDSHPLGMNASFSDYSVNTIYSNLWSINFDDAQSLLLGFLFLKPKFDVMREEIRQENYQKNNRELYQKDILEKFVTNYEKDIEKIIANSITVDEIRNIRGISLITLGKAFQLMPLKISNESHKMITQEIISSFAKRLLSRNREDEVDYQIAHNFFRKFVRVVLSSPRDDVYVYLKPFIEGFNSNESLADLFKEFIMAEDQLKTYDNFWLVWELFYDRVIYLGKRSGDSYYNQKIIESYLFAQSLWSENVTEWETLKEINKRFFNRIARNMGESSAVLYSISKLLNGIGRRYLFDGVTWISRILIEHPQVRQNKLKSDTIYYLENLMRSHIYQNRERIKREAKLKQEVLIILDFLVEKGSVAGYMLRENIL
ncbi:AVAST type 4 anti-phage nuclease Avs4 [Planococcus shixiaomingii]|uniref:AVAST type 4 anti-phage nuclease Avs4 n=1 Tax=Planococcus shixiaomingii TaxID=3058393 RepID=UPI00260B0A86|nr:AVAST type 4 anti-phage nuclease Avs4 [Planococcus sp. N022]WKA54790.1 AVAST type 4 anti-phage nuclease Avs4 [Planococcus sp. N022]